MPQISLYVDNDTLKKITDRAKLEGQSISKWVKSQIIGSISTDWPDAFFSLFGSVKDESFNAPNKVDFSKDSSRIEL